MVVGGEEQKKINMSMCCRLQGKKNIQQEKFSEAKLTGACSEREENSTQQHTVFLRGSFIE